LALWISVAAAGCGAALTNARLIETVRTSPSVKSREAAADKLYWRLYDLRFRAGCSDPRAREQARAELDALNDPSARDALLAAAQDGIGIAGWVLGAVGDERVVAMAEPGLVSPDEMTRRDAFWALRDGASHGRIARAAELLIEKAGDRAFPHRASALHWLGDVSIEGAAAMPGDVAHRILAALIEALDDPDADTRAAGARGLAEFLCPMGSEGREAERVGVRVPTEAMVEHLGDLNPNVRRDLLRVLAVYHHGEPPAELARLLADPDPDVRIAAFQVAEKSPSDALVGGLAQAVRAEVEQW